MLRRAGRRRSAWCLSLCCTVVLLVCLESFLNDISNPTYRQYDQVHEDNSTAQKSATITGSSRQKASEYDDSCPVFRLHPDDERPPEFVACRRADFVPGSCRVMKELFAEKRPLKCLQQLSDLICEIKKYSPEDPQVICHHGLCNESSAVVVGIYRDDTAEYKWYKFKSIVQVKTFINEKLLVDLKINHHGYCFIRCLSRDGRKISQLLILPPVLHKDNKSANKLTNGLNVNILLLDSVSRHHFYRILPKTINTFRNLNLGVFKTGHVFDFELVQGIKSRTFESLQALFGGEAFIPHKPFNSFVLPPKPVDLNKTLGRFKEFGYETLYVEDMCWKWEWGLVKELRALRKKAPISERAKLFLEAVKDSGIDRIDVSYSSCDILQENKVKDMFHGPDAICYNGIHQHTYLLQYIEYFISRFSFLQKPAFTFLMLDTNHEDTGLRLKQVDDDLASHVSFLADQQNTVSIILSDHGNNYGKFVSTTTESQTELFHTTLFIIVPDNVALLLGEETIQSLYTNQHRLISLLDVHQTLQGLLPPVWERNHPNYGLNANGLLSPVSPNRTCSNIPRIPPNFCICQDFEKPAVNGSSFSLFAEFALGQMNQEILQQKMNARTNGSSGCQPLTGIRFDNVKTREEHENETIVKFDLYVKGSKQIGRYEEKYLVVVDFNSQVPAAITLLGFDRLTPYSFYEVCNAQGVDIRLCICDLKKDSKESYWEKENALSPRVTWTETNISSIHESCLYLITRQYASGVALAVNNVCPNVQYDIEFDFLTVNLYSLSLMPVTITLWPGTEAMLTVGIQKNKTKPWKYKYSLNYRTFP